jgi:hypothetical protein
MFGGVALQPDTTFVCDHELIEVDHSADGVVFSGVDAASLAVHQNNTVVIGGLIFFVTVVSFSIRDVLPLKYSCK